MNVMMPELPDGPFTIQEWKHRATMARDHEVKVVYAGFLWPFGHKASLVKVTERKFAPTQPGNPAYLFQRMFIIVREPTRTYTDARTDDVSGKRLDLVMPFKSVTFVTRVTPNLDEPDKLKRDIGHSRDDAGQCDRQFERPIAVAPEDEIGGRQIMMLVGHRPKPRHSQVEQRVDQDRIGDREKALRANAVAGRTIFDRRER